MTVAYLKQSTAIFLLSDRKLPVGGTDPHVRKRMENLAPLRSQLEYWKVGILGSDLRFQCSGFSNLHLRP